MVAKHTSRCVNCGKKINAGDRITSLTGTRYGSWVHKNCSVHRGCDLHDQEKCLLCHPIRTKRPWERPSSDRASASRCGLHDRACCNSCEAVGEI